ncbi:MAG: hypothetical protein MPK62_01010 [Alphaproteobacteria bacterium]|nr:hypothetical protein [Alphaproteobacteria bacterium]
MAECLHMIKVMGIFENTSKNTCEKYNRERRYIITAFDNIPKGHVARLEKLKTDCTVARKRHDEFRVWMQSEGVAC